MCQGTFGKSFFSSPEGPFCHLLRLLSSHKITYKTYNKGKRTETSIYLNYAMKNCTSMIFCNNYIINYRIQIENTPLYSKNKGNVTET